MEAQWLPGLNIRTVLLMLMVRLGAGRGADKVKFFLALAELAFAWLYEPPGNGVKNVVADSTGLGWGPRLCISRAPRCRCSFQSRDRTLSRKTLPMAQPLA